MTTYTLFSQGATGVTVTADTSAYTLGVEFSVSVSGATLTAVWFFSGTGAGATLPGTIALYAVTGTSLVHSESASWSGAAASGWIRAAFATPPSLTASTNYKACILRGSGSNWYSSTAHYWDSGSGSGGITNGPLAAPNNAGASPGQGSFHNGSTITYPGSSVNATNYWVDLEVTTPGGLLIGSFP